MKRLAALALLFLFIACASSDYDEPQRPPARRGGASGGFGYRPQSGGALDMLPPPQWWHDPQIAAAVTLTNEQFASLDKVAKDHEDEIARLERDTATAARDLRTLLETEQPAERDVVAAAQRLRAIRDSAFDHQAQLLAAERAILTRQQWQSLQSALESQRQERRDGGYGTPRGRRGGRGGGRWPGM